jgi:hypothetical protein
MATKISALDSATNIATNDLIQVVDVSDTSMAPTGTNKKATAQVVANELGNLINVVKKLTGSLIYYVRTDGSDSNTGLSDTAGGAFLTIQKALNSAAAFDLNGQAVTINVANGTYTAGASVNSTWINPSSSGVIIQGNASTPANVLLNLTSQNAFQVTNGAILTVKGFKISITTLGSGFYVNQGGVIYWSDIDFGSVPGFHMDVFQNGFARSIGNYSISGGAVGHMHAMQGGKIINNSNIVTITGAPFFSSFFIGIAGPGTAQCIGQTYIGSATGQRYLVHNNALLDLGNIGGPTSYFPGDAAGVTQAYGVYDYKTYGSLALGGSFACSQAPLISPFQYLVDTDVGMRSLAVSGSLSIDATNAAQNAYAPMTLGASLLKLNVSLGNYANDSLAAAAGVAVNQIYRNGSALMIRVV